MPYTASITLGINLPVSSYLNPFAMATIQTTGRIDDHTRRAVSPFYLRHCTESCVLTRKQPHSSVTPMGKRYHRLPPDTVTELGPFASPLEGDFFRVGLFSRPGASLQNSLPASGQSNSKWGTTVMPGNTGRREFNFTNSGKTPWPSLRQRLGGCGQLIGNC